MTIDWSWMTPVLAFAGGGGGAWLSYRAARRDTISRQEGERHDLTQRERQGRREEWGRRFTAALDDIASAEFRRRELGRAVLVHLSKSPLAGDDERELAGVVLGSSAGIELDGDVLGPTRQGIVVDAVDVVEDDEWTERERSSRDQAHPQGRP